MAMYTVAICSTSLCSVHAMAIHRMSEYSAHRIYSMAAYNYLHIYGYISIDTRVTVNNVNVKMTIDVAYLLNEIT